MCVCFASLCGNVTRVGIIYLVRPNTHTHMHTHKVSLTEISFAFLG